MSAPRSFLTTGGRRPAVTVAVVTGALVIAALVAWRWVDGSPRGADLERDGPLHDANGPYVTLFEQRQLAAKEYPDPGNRMTDALAVLEVEGDQEVTLLGVQTTGVDDVVEQVAAYVIGDDRLDVGCCGTYGPFVGEFGDPGSRRHGDLLPVAGQRITSKDDLGLNLVIVYDVLRSDKLWARGDVIVRYESGGETYELHIESGLVFCPRTVTVRECNAFAEAAYPDFPG